MTDLYRICSRNGIVLTAVLLGLLAACGSSPSPQAQASAAIASAFGSQMAAIEAPCASLIGQPVTGKEPGCDGTLIVSAPCLDENLGQHGDLYRGQDKTGAFIFGKVGGVWHRGTASTRQTEMGAILGCK